VWVAACFRKRRRATNPMEGGIVRIAHACGSRGCVKRHLSALQFAMGTIATDGANVHRSQGTPVAAIGASSGSHLAYGCRACSAWRGLSTVVSAAGGGFARSVGQRELNATFARTQVLKPMAASVVGGSGISGRAGTKLGAATSTAWRAEFVETNRSLVETLRWSLDANRRRCFRAPAPRRRPRICR
jgi:hypothetical protein